MAERAKPQEPARRGTSNTRRVSVPKTLFEKVEEQSRRHGWPSEKIVERAITKYVEQLADIDAQMP